MADEILGLNLFGDPVLPRREGRGRPPHEWSRENSNRVLLAFARGLKPKGAATAIGVSVPTLYKVYFNECAIREQAQLRTEMTLMAQLAAKAEGGDTGAIKELFKQLDRLRMRDQAAAIAPPAKAKKPKGVKEQRREAAWSAGEDDKEWNDLLPTPAQPH